MVIYPEPVDASVNPNERLTDSSAAAAGHAALARGAWDDARRAFERVLASSEDPAALEGLGLAAWWLDLTALVFDARERAFRLYRDNGDTRSAARVAVWIGWDYAAFRGEGAVARGWLLLARQLLAGHHDTAEYAWLSVRESALVLMEDARPDEARRLAHDAIDAARAAGSRDFELLATAVDGLALVTAGDVADGMRQLDGVCAAIIGGEMADRVAIGLAGCYVIGACDRVRDYDRASQWCTRIKAFCAKWGLRPLFAVCRTQYAAVCMWNGAWDEAERELVAAVSELSACRPGMTSDGAVRLGELRRRQGRLDEARTLFDGAAAHPLALLGQAALALDDEDATTAMDLAERYLRRVSPQNRTERVAALEVMVRAALASGQMAAARSAIDELDATARDVQTIPFRGTAAMCRGMHAAVTGDLAAARRECEDGVDLFQRSGALYELARARRELAGVLNQAGRTDAAIAELERAVGELRQMSATLELSRVERQLEQLRGRTPRAVPPAGLSRRELEVLRLVAKGLSNQRVAEQLFISEHTVHRHVANTLGKLGVSTRSAAVAQAAKLGLLNE